MSTKRKLQSSMVFTIVALLGLLQPGIVTAQDKEKPRLKIGVVDLGVVFNKFPRKNELEAKINKQKGMFEQALRRQSMIIRRLDEESENLSGRKLEQMEDRLKLELAKRKILKERMQKTLRKDLVEMTLTLVAEINQEIRAYAKENKYSLVLKIDEKGFGREEFREKIFRAQVQDVIHFDESLDITKPVLERLQKKYLSEKRAPKKM